MSGQLPYLVEYAKTGRSKCKGCKNAVEKDHLRIAKIIRSPFHDGVVPNWFHRDCFFVRNRPTSVTEIENFDNIRWEDQESLKKEIESPESLPSPGSSRKRPAGVAPEYTIGYASSNRSKCVACDTPIIKGHVRVSKLDTESKTGVEYQGVTRWHHLDCFIKIREALGYFSSIETCYGFDQLNEKDQKEVAQLIPAVDQPDGPSPSKKAKPASLDPEEEQKLKEQNEQLFKCREELEKLKQKDALSYLLETNDQFVPKGRAEILNSLTDQMIFGALKPCKKCSGMFQFMSGIGYKCQGDLTEWTKCQELTLEPERTEFKVPESLKSTSDFLKDYKSSISRRILRISESPTLKTIKKSEETANLKVNRGPMPLRGMKFVIVGRTVKSKEVLRKEIMELGGSVVGTVQTNVAAVIANEKTLEHEPNNIWAAKKYEIQVVTEDFVDEAKDYEDPPIALIMKKNIAKWGADPKTRVDVSIMESCGKSASGFEKKSAGKVKMVFADGCAVDPDSGMVDTAYVHSDEGGKYSVTLVQTDIQSKKNSFYKMQVLKNKYQKVYSLFRSWGRIGTTAGGNKCDRMPSETKAVNNFLKIFKEKTGNAWSDRKDFVKKPGLMYPIDDEEPQEEKCLDSSNSEAGSSLSKPVQELMQLIFNVDMMKHTLKEFELDTDKMPLGKLSRRQLEKAYGVLKEVQELLANGQPDRALLVDASNRFYTLVPHSFGVDEPPVLDNSEFIQNKCQMLDSLIEMEIAYGLLNSKPDNADKHPLDACYEQLKAEIEILDRNSEEFKMIEQYTKNTHGITHGSYDLDIQNVFVVKRQGERERYTPFQKLHNRKLLWHGSRTTNYAGILSQGLRIAPPEAPVSGYMFGKGVYFADMVSKSANYCCTNNLYPTGLLMLCEVALGDMYEKYDSEFITKLPDGKHSTLGLGSTRPDPKDFFTTKDGVVIPYGKGVPSNHTKYCCLLYNEYIVYNVAQINIKYLIEMDFKYKY